jgi:preprotein translocase subunit Sss1
LYVAALAFSILQAVEPEDQFSKRDLVYGGTCLGAGILGGFLATVLWKLGLVLTGGAMGYIISLSILTLKSESFVVSPTARTVFIILCVISSAILIFFFERHLLIIGTSFSGAYSMVLGIDFFANTGFLDHLLVILETKDPPKTDSVGPAFYGLVASMFLMGLIGMLVQYKFTARRK